MAAVSVAMTLAVLSASLSGADGSASQRWRISELAAPVGWSDCSPQAINESGQVLFWCSRKNRVHSFLWSNGRTVDVGAVAGKRLTEATAINNHGKVIGSSWTKQDHYGDPIDQHAFVWQNGSIKDMGPGEAVAINDRGQVVGWRTVFIGGHLTGYARAFLWQHGETTYLDPKRATHSTGVAINERGQVAVLADWNTPQERSWLWQDGRRTSLGSRRAELMDERGQVLMDNPTLSDALLWQNGRIIRLGLSASFAGWGSGAMNDRGQVVGCGGDLYHSRFHARLWQRGNTIDLGTIPGARQSAAIAINNAGQVVGASGNLENLEPIWRHAFVWQNGKMTDLGTLPADTQSSAAAINNLGQILGTSTNKSGRTRIVIWTPQRT
jgi:probable HAF family extracellular repeat protein